MTAFFVGIGLEPTGPRMVVEGEFLDTVIGIPAARTEIVMLRPPDGGTCLEQHCNGLNMLVRHCFM